jgi:hypothetical protein
MGKPDSENLPDSVWDGIFSDAISVALTLMPEYCIVLSMITPDGYNDEIDDVSQLICCVDGRWCRDFVHCLKFDFVDGAVVLLWRCPRLRKAVYK